MAAFRAKIHDGLRGGGADAGERFEFFRCGCVQIEGVRGGIFIGWRGTREQARSHIERSDQAQTRTQVLSHLEPPIGRLRPAAERSLDGLTLCIIFRDWAEEGGLLGDFLAVADEDDLRVCGIEVASRGGEDIVGSKLANALAVRF